MARRDAPTCSLDERVGDVRARAESAGWDASVVLNAERVVFGLLRGAELTGDPDRRVEQAMRPGPSTYRPHVPIEEMAEVMIEHDMPNCPITTSDGRLVGLLRREDAARVALEVHRAHAHDTEEEDEDT